MTGSKQVAKTFSCSIVTPQEALFDGEVSYVTFPSWDGQYGMLPGMAPLLSKLAIGMMRVDLTDGATRYFAIEGGFAHVHDNTLTLLTEGAQDGAEIDIELARAAVAEAEARVVSETDNHDRIRRQNQIASMRLETAKHATGRGAA
jgi:F-type H+-transporting ATPase subunit epsilon